jgi:hypothetical protein
MNRDDWVKAGVRITRSLILGESRPKESGRRDHRIRVSPATRGCDFKGYSWRTRQTCPKRQGGRWARPRDVTGDIRIADGGLMVLITYHFKPQSMESNLPGSFHYSVATSATDWIEEMEAHAYEDGTYVLVHVLDLTDEQAARYDGALQSM